MIHRTKYTATQNQSSISKSHIIIGAVDVGTTNMYRKTNQNIASRELRSEISSVGTEKPKVTKSPAV